MLARVEPVPVLGAEEVSCAGTVQVSWGSVHGLTCQKQGLRQMHVSSLGP